MSFGCLATSEGEAFRRDCQRSGKAILVWTVNVKEEMMQVSPILDIVLGTQKSDRFLLGGALGRQCNLNGLHPSLARSAEAPGR